MTKLNSIKTSKNFVSVERELNKTFLRLAFVVINLFGLSALLNAQVQYGAAANFGLRKVVPTYTGNAIQVRRDCDNATTNIGFTSCGTLDTIALRSFVLSGNPLSAITPSAEGAYSLRKLRCAYAGSAINVRRSCDNATRDIGFTSNGDLDTVALKAFVMASNPISALSVNANVAYSLRKLRCAYSGFAIQVRRSSDNATQDIGFTVNGDLDTTALKTFVGVGNSGFVSIWYDQSGNPIPVNVAPPAAANQPRIINAGVVERRNGVPTLFFDGANDYFTTNSFSTTGYTGFSANVVASWTTGGGIRVLIDNNHNCNQGFVFQDRNDLAIQPLQMVIPNPGNCNGVSDIITTGNGSLRILSYVNNTTTETGYRNGLAFASQGYTGAYVIQTAFLIGAWSAGPARFFSGQMSEVILFKSALSNTDRQYLEWGQSQYFSISGPTLSSTLPAGAPSAFVTTWYDQSGNNRHATQATPGSQPRIINAGIIEKNASNRPSIFFNSTYLKNAFFLTTQPVSTSCVWRARGLANPGGELFGWGDNGGGGRRYGAWFAFNSATQGRYGVENLGAGMVGSTLLNTNTWYISSQILPGTSLPALTQWINGASQAMTNLGTPAAMNITAGEFAIGTIPTANTQGHNGDIQELIYFSTALSATDRQYIEYGQSVYYGISGPTVPSTLPVTPPSAYVSIWYDQSGNGINLSQTGAITRQPQIVNAGNIIRLNGSSTWPAMQGTNALQTNLTATFASAYTGNLLTVNSVLRSDISSNANLRVWSVGNTALTSADFSNVNFANINQRGGNNFVFERSGVNPSTAFTVGAPMILSGRFNGTNRQLFNNGTGSATQADANAFNFNSIRLLQSINPGFEAGEALTGKMAEFSQFYSALSTTRRTLIETNQSAFYSIAVSNSKYTPPTSSSYIYYVNGIGRESATDSVAATRQSSGMGFRVGAGAGDFLKDNGDYLTCGINCPITPAISTSNLPATVIQRWLNDWYINKTDINSNNGLVTLYFDFGDYGIGNSPGVPSNYVLLYRNSPSATFSIVPGTTPSVSGDQVRFAVDASNITTNYYYTIGTLDPTTSPLPIELLEFKAKLGKEGVEISWITATEINNDFFTVEKSNSGFDFYSLTKIAGAGNSTQQLKYSVTDISPFQGVNYYRLKQTDYDGKFDYSRVISVDVESPLPTNSIYPNPNEGKSFYVMLPKSGYRNILIKIQGLDGKTILSETVYKSGTFEFIPSVKLASGVYIISIFDNGNFSNVKLVVK
ncbi:MAG: T9SS type A sorting domain-containing protein [Microcystis sp. LE19-388.1G]|nr:T9SS type A sorting domain-containing protein [Microcystis sp. LE19-388.1G]